MHYSLPHCQTREQHPSFVIAESPCVLEGSSQKPPRANCEFGNWMLLLAPRNTLVRQAPGMCSCSPSVHNSSKPSCLQLSCQPTSTWVKNLRKAHLLICAHLCDDPSSGRGSCSIYTAYRIPASESVANFLDVWAFVQFFMREWSTISPAPTCDSQNMLCKSSRKWCHVSVCELWIYGMLGRVQMPLTIIISHVEVVKQRDLFKWIGGQWCFSKTSTRT